MSQSFSQQSASATATQDVVGVFDGFDQVFREARPMTASVKEEAKLMEHPTESGAVITDHMVIQPVEIELILTLTPAHYRNSYQEIKKLYQEARLLTVQTRAESYPNQIIAALPHEESPEHVDAITLTLRLKEVKIVDAEFRAEYKPRRPAQSRTSDRGEIQAREEPRGSWAAKHLPIGK